MKRFFIFFIFAGVFLFYWEAGIVNHTEADDAFEYAHMVEMDHHPWEYHPHHLLYGGVAKILYNGAQVLGYNGRAYSFLLFFSAFSAAGTLFLFYRFCRRRYHFLPLAAGVSAGLLGLSYGFWRYACEAEVVLPAGFFALLAVYLATTTEPRKQQVVVASLISGVSVLFHVINGIPAVVAISVFYILQRKFRFALIHLTITGSVVLAAYLLVFFFHPDQILIHAAPPLTDGFCLSVIPKGMVGFGQCLVSGNFMFGFPAFSDRLVQLFPSRMLMEELYLGNHLSLFQRIAPLFSLVLLSVALLGCLVRAIVAWKKEWTNNRADMLLMVGGWQTITVAGLWFFIYVAALLMMEPGNPEVWILGLVPFWLLVCGLVIAPIARANALWVVLSMLLALGLHNYVGGIGILKDPDTDYNQKKAAWVLANGKSDDLVITAGNPVFVRYLRYYSTAEVIDLNYIEADVLAKSVEDAKTIYILNDIFDYPASMCIRFPAIAEQIDRYAVELKPHARLLVENEFGGVWILER